MGRNFPVVSLVHFTLAPTVTCWCHHSPAHLRQRNTHWILIDPRSLQDLYLSPELLPFSWLLCDMADLLVESADLLGWDPVQQLLQLVWAVQWRISRLHVSRRAKEPADQQTQRKQAQTCWRVPVWRWVTGDVSVYRGPQQPIVPHNSQKVKSHLPLVSTPPVSEDFLQLSQTLSFHFLQSSLQVWAFTPPLLAAAEVLEVVCQPFCHLRRRQWSRHWPLCAGALVKWEM